MPVTQYREVGLDEPAEELVDQRVAETGTIRFAPAAGRGRSLHKGSLDGVQVELPNPVRNERSRGGDYEDLLPITLLAPYIGGQGHLAVFGFNRHGHLAPPSGRWRGEPEEIENGRVDADVAHIIHLAGVSPLDPDGNPLVGIDITLGQDEANLGVRVFWNGLEGH